MAWVKFDDGYADHLKVAGLTDAAFRLHTAGILYCGKHLTDGIIQAAEVPRLVRRYRPKALAELVEGGLWVPLLEGGLFRIHDYLQWNDPADVVKARRDAAAKRKADYLAKKGKGAA